MKMYNPPHPGELIKGLWLDPLGVSITEAAQAMAISRKTLSKIVNGRGRVTPEIAVRLSIALGSSAESWLAACRRGNLDCFSLAGQHLLSALVQHNGVQVAIWRAISSYILAWAATITPQHELPPAARRAKAGRPSLSWWPGHASASSCRPDTPGTIRQPQQSNRATRIGESPRLL